MLTITPPMRFDLSQNEARIYYIYLFTLLSSMKWRTSSIRTLLYCTWRFTGINLCRKIFKIDNSYRHSNAISDNYVFINQK
jgi:hypothetical protein